MLLELPRHSIVLETILASEYSIQVTAGDPTLACTSDGRKIIHAYLACPHCWEKGGFIEEMESGKPLIILCEATQKKFVVNFGDQQLR